jgi:hypothetical protein
VPVLCSSIALLVVFSMLIENAAYAAHHIQLSTLKIHRKSFFLFDCPFVN